MKTLLITFIFLGISGLASAETCTALIKDRQGQVWEAFTRSSYSRQAACDVAKYDCNGALAYGQSVGRYYGAFCEIQSPRPTQFICQTDLVDYYGRILRSFTAPGSSVWDACRTSDNICEAQRARSNGSEGTRCVNRGTNPRPPIKTEQCSVNRFDPAGMFIQRYIGRATGPINSDVLGEACRQAISLCSRDLKGRQTCNVSR